MPFAVKRQTSVFFVMLNVRLTWNVCRYLSNHDFRATIIVKLKDNVIVTVILNNKTNHNSFFTMPHSHPWMSEVLNIIIFYIDTHDFVVFSINL
jgi:hypothetical protein